MSSPRDRRSSSPRTLGLAAAAVLALAGAAPAGPAAAQIRDEVRIVGSSTVFPFTIAAAERFGMTSEHPTPIVESTGSGGGIRLFCQGLGADTPDITGASRAITEAEVESCAANGVAEVGELVIGYDGIVFAGARAAPRLPLDPPILYRALAAELPVDGEIVANPNETWADIDPALPDTPIRVIGPPPTSGTRDVVKEMVMEVGCDADPAMAALAESEPQRHEALCMTLRDDGAWIDAGENDNMIVQRLTADETTIGVFGFSYLDANRDRVAGNPISGVEPTYETIADGRYPLSRPLMMYVKEEHFGLIPGLGAFLESHFGPRAMAPDGYLADLGLIPVSEEKRRATLDAVAAGDLSAPAF
ncbi:MAG: substrate-binding domain-containing protein [Azospirillaceae bacterium]